MYNAASALENGNLSVFNKFVVRNVGVLRAFDTPKSPQLAQLTLFYGRNGRGKSTLTSILRAARDACAATVLARRSLGNGGIPPEVILTSGAGNIQFKAGAWKPKGAPIEVFDTSFVTDNIFAGEIIDLAHDRSLFSIIIGTNGVRLAKHLERFNLIARKSSDVLKETEAALRDDIPSDLNKDEFFAILPGTDIAARLDVAERSLKAVQQAETVSALTPFEHLNISDIPGGARAVLEGTIADIDTSARLRLREHFKRFGFDRTAEAWITYGMDHIKEDSCPFCGRDHVDANGTISLYSKIFGETYKSHLSSILTTASLVEDLFGEAARTVVGDKIALNAQAIQQWGKFVVFPQDLPDMSNLISQIQYVHGSLNYLFDRKKASPLDAIDAKNSLDQIKDSISKIKNQIEYYNEIVDSFNKITKKIVDAEPTTVSAASLIVENLKKRSRRYDDGVQKRIAAFLLAKRRDHRARTMRTKVQARLKKANEDSAAHYYQKVNFYLKRFGASFSISKITSSMHGNAGQTDYGFVIKGEAVSRGRGRQTDAVPTFRNTLSAGDKITLAFAFFLAKLDQDTSLHEKTLVIDDPLSSHDSHRRRETVNAIQDLCSRCRQVVVLSHDEFLLRDIERRCSNFPSVAFEIEFDGADGWSGAKLAELDRLCRAGHVKLVDEIIAFVDGRIGSPDDVVLKIRQVLETHYRRSYAAYFGHAQNLGSIIKTISAEAAAHPCFRDLKKLDNCNEATCDKHHGDDSMVIAKRGVDPDELHVIAVDALELIGARRPTISP